MKAAWYERQGAARDVLIFGEMADPHPGGGEVRIRVAFSGVNPGDVKKREDAFGVGMPYPRVIPHSMEGERHRPDPQDERRRIFEESSRHVRTGLKYLPGIARRLHHCRDLGEGEPFDFLTWFDYAPQHAQPFEELVAELRSTEEWKFVEREVDIRLKR